MSDIVYKIDDEKPENVAKSAENTAETEQHIAEATCRIDAATQRKLQKNTRLSSIIATVAGAILLLVAVVISTMNGEIIGGKEFVVSEPVIWVYYIFGAILLVFGIVFIFIANRNVAAAARTNAENHYQFFADHVAISVTQNGEDIGSVKVYYSNFVKIRENADFILLYPNASAVYPVPKADLTQQQCAALRSALSLKK